MTIFGLAPLTKAWLTKSQASWPYDVAVLGFFGSAAFLTALSFRRTQQNGNPAEAWSVKVATVAIGILCSGIIVCLAQAAFGILVWREFNPGRAMEPVLFLTIIVCSTGFWTLVARSIIGGLILTAAAQLFLYLLLVVFVRAIDAMAPGNPYPNRISHAPEVHAAMLPFIAGVGLSYAAMMLWLGRKKFLAMQGMVS